MRTASNKKHNHKKQASDNILKLLLWLLVFATVVTAVIFFSYNLMRTDKSDINKATLTVSNIDSTKLNTDEKQAYAKVQDFFTALRSNKYTTAYDSLGEVLKKQYPAGLNDFTASVKNANLGAIRQWAVTSVETNGAKDRISVKGNAVFDTSNPKAKFEFGFYKNADGNFQIFAWQIYPEM